MTLATGALPPSAQRVVDALAAGGLNPKVVFTSESTRTVQEAAKVLGVEVAQIAKSLIFRGTQSGRAVLVVAAGDNRVDTAKVSQLFGERVERADADFVRTITGFSIGGVPPIAHAGPVFALCDVTLARFRVVWAAAGTPHAVFSIDPQDLFRLVGGAPSDVRVDSDVGSP